MPVSYLTRYARAPRTDVRAGDAGDAGLADSLCSGGFPAATLARPHFTLRAFGPCGR